MMDGMGMMMWFSLFLGFLLIVLIVLALLAVVQWLRSEKSPLLTGRGDALEILRKRYAKGEIGKDEYERMKRDIE